MSRCALLSKHNHSRAWQAKPRKIFFSRCVVSLLFRSLLFGSGEWNPPPPSVCVAYCGGGGDVCRRHGPSLHSIIILDKQHFNRQINGGGSELSISTTFRAVTHINLMCVPAACMHASAAYHAMGLHSIGEVGCMHPTHKTHICRCCPQVQHVVAPANCTKVTASRVTFKLQVIALGSKSNSSRTKSEEGIRWR